MASHPEVVILGAGLAGMTAAYHLRDRDVVVIESRDRVGGRTLSGEHDSYWYNSGAQFVWDARTVALCSELGLGVLGGEGALSAVFVNGRLAVAPDANRLFMKMPVPWVEKARFGLTSTRLSTHEVSGAIGLGYAIHLFGGDVNSTLKAVRGGTQQISKTIAEAIDPERLMLECKVESVTASGGGVTVRYRRGEREPEEVEAAICISAMTADAVLEAMPDLPEAKREALRNVLPYAPVVTVAWLTDEAGPMPWDQLLAVPAIGLSFELLSNNAFFLRRDSTARRKGGSLVTLATGPRAEALVALTDEAIVARVRGDLLKMFPSERDVLERAITRVERWRGLPRFGKGWLGRQQVLREPFGSVHFCGDYTAQPGTPGAVGSGYHAAKTVRALLG